MTELDLPPLSRRALKWGDGEAKAVFLAANGFPVRSYDFLLKELSDQWPLLGLENRGVWDKKVPPEGFDWHGHAEDLLASLEPGAIKLPTIGIGHSIGATVAALAARRHPERFRALVLIDPATVPGRWLPLLVRLVPTLTKRMELVTRTRNRREIWPDSDAFVAYHREKAVYRSFTEQAMADYGAAALRSQGSGYTLAYSREWEAWNFQHTAVFWPVARKLEVPTLILRGETSYLHPQAEFARNQRRLPGHIQAITVPGVGHMLPQEAPEQVLSLIGGWLAEL